MASLLCIMSKHVGNGSGLPVQRLWELPYVNPGFYGQFYSTIPSPHRS